MAFVDQILDLETAERDALAARDDVGGGLAGFRAAGFVGRDFGPLARRLAGAASLMRLQKRRNVIVGIFARIAARGSRTTSCTQGARHRFHLT
jgi:hypothetical protein